MSKGDSNISHQINSKFGTVGEKYNEILVAFSGHFARVAGNHNTFDFEAAGKNSAPFVNAKVKENFDILTGIEV